MVTTCRQRVAVAVAVVSVPGVEATRGPAAGSASGGGGRSNRAFAARLCGGHSWRRRRAGRWRSLRRRRRW